MKSDRLSKEFVYSVLECAVAHAENSEPDHEVGDLRDFLVACWSVMSPEQRRLALSDPHVQDVMGGPEYESLSR